MQNEHIYWSKWFLLSLKVIFSDCNKFQPVFSFQWLKHALKSFLWNAFRKLTKNFNRRKKQYSQGSVWDECEVCRTIFVECLFKNLWILIALWEVDYHGQKPWIFQSHFNALSMNFFHRNRAKHSNNVFYWLPTFFTGIPNAQYHDSLRKLSRLTWNWSS